MNISRVWGLPSPPLFSLPLPKFRPRACRLFANDRLYITLGKALYVLLVTRQKSSFRDHASALRITKRVLNMWCQNIEVRMERSDGPVLHECPEPQRCASYHPLLKHSRRRGSTVLKQTIFARFAKRTSGFLSTKDDANLKDLGLVGSNNRLASTAGSEYLIRYLAKISELAQASAPENSRVRFLNFCMDSARACTFEASLQNLGGRGG